MNGAAMDCRQDQVLRSQHKGSSGLHSPGYHFQINRSRQQNSHPQHSKTKNYQLLSETVLVDRSSEYLQHKDYYDVNSRQKSVTSDVWDPRSRTPQPRTPHPRTREPLELPVPQFQIDENYVGEPPPVEEFVEDSKSLDLDTRIDLLIKSKALAGMHPIFSELDQSGESSYDSDESFLNGPTLKKRLEKRRRSSRSEGKNVCQETFYDPEMPLSRPPSPFLSRATYLFWFNKAIEIKQQAKAQEQALLEKANKRLLQENVLSVKTVDKIDKTSPIIKEEGKEGKPIINSLLEEISKELKEIVKQEFIKEVLQHAAFSTLENWWEKQSHIKEGKSMASSVTNLVPKECKTSIDKTIRPSEKVGLADEVKAEYQESTFPKVSLTDEVKAEYQGSTSPKVPFPGTKVVSKIDGNLEKKDSIVPSINNHLNPSQDLETSSKTDKVKTLGDGSVFLGSEGSRREDSDNELCDRHFTKDQKAISTSCEDTAGHSPDHLPESMNISQPVSKLSEPTSQYETFSDHAYALLHNSSPCGGVAEECINQTVRNTMDSMISHVERETSIEDQLSYLHAETTINEEQSNILDICNYSNVSSSQGDDRLNDPESTNKDIVDDKCKSLQLSLPEISNSTTEIDPEYKDCIEESKTFPQIHDKLTDNGDGSDKNIDVQQTVQ